MTVKPEEAFCRSELLWPPLTARMDVVVVDAYLPIGVTNLLVASA